MAGGIDPVLPNMGSLSLSLCLILQAVLWLVLCDLVVCTDDSDCGGSKRGKCNEKKHCECRERFTGPTCLAYVGFYDHEDVEVVPPFQCKLHQPEETCSF